MTSTIEVVTPMVMPSRTPTPEQVTPQPLVEFVTPEQTVSAEITSGSRPPATRTPAATVEPTSLRWRIRTADPSEIAIYEALNRRLNSDSAETELVFESRETDYLSQLRSEIADGTAPDVFWLAGTDLADFVRDGLVQDLFELAEDSAEFDLADFHVGPMLHLTFDPDTGQSGQRLWGLPRDVSTLVLYLNLELLDRSEADDPRELATEDDWNWDRFAEVAGQISALEDDVYGFGQFGWWGTHGYWIQAAGGDYFNAQQNACALDSDETVLGVTFERSLYEDGLALPIAERPDNAFFEGRIGMYLSGRWQTPQLRQLEPFDWDVVELPTGPDRSFNYLTWGAYVVSATAEDPAAAWELVQMLTSAETQQLLTDSGLTMPSRLDPAAVERFKSATPPENAQAFLNGIDSQTVAETPLWSGDWQRWDTTVNGALYRVVSGSLSPADFAATICVKANPVFDRRPTESISTK